MAAGLAGVLAPALGWAPALGGVALSGEPFRALLDWPGFWRAAALSLWTGLASTALSLALALGLCAAWRGTRAFAVARRALSPFLAAPHAAAAFGLAFLIAPSGWIARAFSPWATDWRRPPDWLIPGDAWGLSLIAGLALKEAPFLLLMTLAALGRVEEDRAVLLARTMGYGRSAAWLKAVAPQIWPQLRLPVAAVLAYSVSTVDVALILGPSAPPPLAVQALRWAAEPDLSRRFLAAAAAMALLLLTMVALGLWLLGEAGAARLAARWREGGARWRRDRAFRAATLLAAVAAGGALAAGLASLAVWSVAGLWPFPDLWPERVSARVWAREAPGLLAAAGETAAIGLAATAAALALAVACLEAERRHGLRPGPAALLTLYLPLLVPQAAFLMGLQTLALAAGLDGGRWSVTAAHAVFVTPYVFLSLSGAWRAWDGRYGLAAAALGAGPARVFLAVRAPMLLRPLLTAAAVGFAVSVAQYLPTLLIGGGRVVTLTTEAVALAAGGDRRVIGAVAAAQSALPLLGFAAALAIPAWAFRDRRGMAA